MLIDKRSVIDIVWQYSRFYGERLSDCERLFENEEGYAALILLFEITENICKFAAGNYEEKFQIIVDKLHKQDDSIQPFHTPFPILNQSTVP